MRIIIIIFIMLIPINFIGLCECKNWQKDEKYWLFALAMNMCGLLYTTLILMSK